MYSNRRNQRGFTLAELLIVAAIIGVLTAVGVPVFTNQLEKGRESVDLSNARTAYSELMAAAISDDGTATYNGKTIKQNSGEFKVVFSPLKQSKDGWTTNIENLSIGSAPSSEWEGQPQAGGSCTITFTSETGAVSVSWGTGFTQWKKLEGTTVASSSWQNKSDAREAGWQALRQQDNTKRKNADIEILDALADYFNGKSTAEVRSILGDIRYNKITGNSKDCDQLFEYCVDNGGSIRINGLDTDYQPYFQDLGYDAKAYNTNNPSADHIGGYYTGNNYMDKYLFTSNELTNKVGSGFHVLINFDTVDGKVVNTRVWIRDLDSQGYKSGS